MDHEEIRTELEKVKELFEVARLVEEFHCYRHFGSQPQSVTVKVFDYGVTKKDRYYCEATTPDGRFASGNPDHSVGLAVFGVQWEKLDRPKV